MPYLKIENFEPSPSTSVTGAPLLTDAPIITDTPNPTSQILNGLNHLNNKVKTKFTGVENRLRNIKYLVIFLVFINLVITYRQFKL